MSLLKLAKNAKGDPTKVRQILVDNRCGRLFSVSQLREGKPWLFEPPEETVKAFANGGLHPATTVHANLLLPSFQKDNFDDLLTLTNRHREQLKEASAGSQDREFSARCLCKVFEQTICLSN